MEWFKGFVAVLIAFVFTACFIAVLHYTSFEKHHTHNWNNKSSSTETVEADRYTAPEFGDFKAVKKKTQKISFFEPANILTILFGFSALVVSIYSLWQNKRSNEIQNRAYLYVESCELAKSESGRITVRAKIVNGGATPAKNIRKQVWLGAIEKHQFSNPIPSTIPLSQVEKSSLYLAPNDYKWSIIQDRDMPESDVRLVESGEKCTKFILKVTYEDAFGNHREMAAKFKSLGVGKKAYGQMTIADEGLQST